MVTADELESRCAIEIVGVKLAEREPKFLTDVMALIAHHVAASTKIVIYCAARKDTGWLEWSIVVNYSTGRSLVIGAIQRKADAEVEFHS